MINFKVNKQLRISPSSLDTFFKCSMQYKWTTIDEIKPEEGSDNLYGVLGSSFHKIMELQDRFNLTQEKMLEFWSPLFLIHLSNTPNLPKGINYQPFISRGPELIKNGLKLKERWKNTQKVGNEIYCRLEYKNKFIEDINLSGIIDLLVKDNNGIFTIIDWKTAKTKESDIDSNFQLTFYIYYIHHIYKIDYEDIFGSLAYPVHCDMLFTQRTQSDIDKLFEKIDIMLKRISESDFKKEPKLTMNLNDCFFCAYKRRCEKYDN